MNSCPSEPGDYSAQPESTCLKDRESRSDNGHIPSIEIPKRCGGWLTKQALSDAPAGVLALLNRHLGDARQWLSILLEGSRISNYVYVWISGNGEIVLNTNAPGVVGLRAQPFAFIRFHKNPIDMLELRCQQRQFGDTFARRTGSTTIRDTTAERVSISLRKAGKRRHAICKPGAWPREVHSLPAPSYIT